MRRRLLAVLSLAMACGAAAAMAPARPAGTFATEDSTAGWQPVPEALARALVAGGEAADREIVDDEIKDRELPRNYRQFLRSHPVQLAAAGAPARFVRPASQPRYNAFYGAHVFRFFFVGADGRVLYTASADKVAVLSAVHEGMHDLKVSQCRGGECFETTAVFEHGHYRDDTCATTAIESGQSTPGCR